jgi:RimJ/RimL family protein N-acetyltransferase
VIVVETDRLTLRRLTVDDAAFILELLNEPSFLEFIEDRGVRTLEDARRYILTGPVQSYERWGFGLYLTVLKESGAPIGICGLLKRDSLEDVDIGFALVPRFWSRGYALEAAAAVMAYGRDVLGIHRIVAITSPANHASMRVLQQLGLRFDRMIRLPGEETETRLFTPDA